MKPLAIIACMAMNRVIGANGHIPWHLPEDMKFFRESTTGGSIIMGRKTYESIGRALPKRTNIVVSRKWAESGHTPEGCKVAGSLDDARELAEYADGSAFVIGGGELYRAAMPMASVILLSQYERIVEGDVVFPWISDEFAQADYSRLGPEVGLHTYLRKNP